MAQTVFVDLARKAGSLNANILLIGWLHRGARLAALEQRRADQRRQNRERQAMEFLDSTSESSSDWNMVCPVLDEAIANLGSEDRNALLLRFFKNESLASVGATLGVGEDAAQKRVSRALGKLREFLEQRGIKTTAAALSAALMSNAVQSAPAGFVSTLAASSLAKAALAGGSAAPLIKLFNFTNMKAAFLIVALAGGIAGITAVRIQSQHRLRDAQAFAQTLTDEIASLRIANEQLANQTNELARLRADTQDTLRLRAEVTRLRRDLAALNATVASAETRAKTEQATQVESPQQINFRAKFIAVPSRYFPSDSTGQLSEPEMKQLTDSLGRIPDAATIRGDVTTLSDRQSQIFIPFATLETGDQSSFNLSLDVMATSPTNSTEIQMELTAATIHYFTGQPNPYGPAFGGDQRSLFFLTNSFALAESQTMVVTRKLPGEWISSKTHKPQEDLSLVLLLTPTLIDEAGNAISKHEPLATSTQSSRNVFPGVAPDGSAILMTPQMAPTVDRQ